MLYFNGIRMGSLLKLTNNLLLLALYACSIDYNAHCINTRGQMLKGYIVIFKGFKNLSAKAKLAIHHILFKVDDGEALFTCNACDSTLGRGIGHYHCAIVLWGIGVLNVDWYSCTANGEYSILMQNSSTHVAKLS